MRTAVLLTALMSGSLLNFSAGAVDESAPFGFSWGPVDKVPRPSLATREENVTRLTYFPDRLPPTSCVTPRRLSSKSAKMRVFNKSFG